MKKDIERVYIAGGFGNYIHITDAINIGLLPDLPEERFEYLGNSSIQGAMIVLLSQKALAEAEAISNSMTYIELSIGNMFMDEFVSALFIPHTDMSLFPSVEGKGDKKALVKALAGIIPADPMITEFDIQGTPLFELPRESAAVKAVNDMLGKLKI